MLNLCTEPLGLHTLAEYTLSTVSSVIRMRSVPKGGRAQQLVLL